MRILGRQLLADGCLWGLAPQSRHSPICLYFPSSAFGEHWEPRLPASCGHSLAAEIREINVSSNTDS